MNTTIFPSIQARYTTKPELLPGVDFPSFQTAGSNEVHREERAC